MFVVFCLFVCLFFRFFVFVFVCLFVCFCFVSVNNLETDRFTKHCIICVLGEIYLKKIITTTTTTTTTLFYIPTHSYYISRGFSGIKSLIVFVGEEGGGLNIHFHDLLLPSCFSGELTATSLQHWIAGHDKRATTELTDANFKQLVAVTEDKTTQWLVLL